MVKVKDACGAICSLGSLGSSIANSRSEDPEEDVLESKSKEAPTSPAAAAEGEAPQLSSSSLVPSNSKLEMITEQQNENDTEGGDGSEETATTNKEDDDDDDDVKAEAKQQQQPDTDNEEPEQPEIVHDLPIPLISMEERDFDQNPTELYASLMRKDWDVAVQHAPSEAHVWIYRKETVTGTTGTTTESNDSKLRWRLLPLHAAIIFHAPLTVIEALLKAYPSAVACKDDQGMLPLHLAVRMGSCSEVIDALVAEQPLALRCVDRKGRTPQQLAAAKSSKASSPQNQQAGQMMVDALKQAAAAAGAAVAAVGSCGNMNSNDKNAATTTSTTTTTPRSAVAQAAVSPSVATTTVVDSNINKAELELETLRDALRTQQQAWADEKAILEKHKESDGAVIAQLEQQLADQEAAHAERLQSLQQLTEEHRQLQQLKQQTDADNKAVLGNLVSQVGDLQNKVEQRTADCDQLRNAQQQAQETAAKESAQWHSQRSELERQLGQVTYVKEELEASLTQERQAHANCQEKLAQAQHRGNELHAALTVCEAKLEEVTLSEQELAWQKESLTVQVQETVAQHDKQVRQLELERNELRATVDKLSVKLYKVVGFLDEMVQEQEDIILSSSSMASLASSTDGQGNTTTTGQEAAVVVTTTETPQGVETTRSTDSGGSESQQKQPATPKTATTKPSLSPSAASHHLLSGVGNMKEQISAVIDSVRADHGEGGMSPPTSPREAVEVTTEQAAEMVGDVVEVQEEKKQEE